MFLCVKKKVKTFFWWHVYAHSYIEIPRRKLHICVNAVVAVVVVGSRTERKVYRNHIYGRRRSSPINARAGVIAIAQII